jgi:hypothetical protein
MIPLSTTLKRPSDAAGGLFFVFQPLLLGNVLKNRHIFLHAKENIFIFL